ncbi:hypothetical protein D9M70_399640 [compost metagenome]
MRQANRLLDSVGGAQGADAISNAMQTAMQRGGVEEAAKLAKKAGGSAFWTFYKSMLLSSPDTHQVNIVGNAATAILQVPERFVAGVISKLKGRRGEVKLMEPIYQLGGAVEGMVNGMRAAVDTWRTGADPLGINKAEAYRNDAPGQKVWGVPLRLLQSEDAFFQLTGEGMERYALAYRQAAKEGGSPAQISIKAKELIRNPTEQIKTAAEQQALYQTFNNRAGEVARLINRLRIVVPGGQLIIPFVRTPANIINFALKRTALAPLYAEVRDDVRVGGARQEQALARIAVGTMIQAVAVLAYQSGNLVGGGPDDPEEKRAWLAAGNQPYSVKINGQWWDYSRFDPFASLIGIAADVASMSKDPDVGLASIVKALGRIFLSKTWLSGLSSAMQALTDPDRYGERWLDRTAATLLQPSTLLAHIGRWQDPYRREAKGLGETILNRLPAIPGITDGRLGLPERLDAYGGPIPEPRRQMGRAGPFPITVPSDDPVKIEGARLGWSPGAPQKHIKSGGKVYPLNEREYHEFQELAGKMIRKGIAKLIRRPAYQRMDDDEKRDALDEVAKQSRAAVRLAMLPYLTNSNRKPLEQLRRHIEGGA